MTELIRNGALTVGTTSLQAVPPLVEGQRTALTIINTSTSGQIMTITWGGEGTPLTGIVLYAGGSWSESRDAVFMPSNEPVWVVSSAIGGTIAIHERIRTLGR
ncbi:unnamed protein product [marine sediment metagenome]|uniref:Uncharacterized protein n=1 Tax=marine sediment metagenome TaxID=412755 RepID=X1UDV4_9ZZZZ